MFDQGAEARSFFVLLHGHLRVEKTTPQGQQIVVRYVSAGELFGVAQAMALKNYPATAIAVVDSVALSWPSTLWPELIVKFPALAAGALQTVGSRLQDTQNRVLEMSSEQVEQRVAHALLRLAKQAGRKVEHGVEIDFPISRQDVAEMTGTTLHTVSRILSAWGSRAWSRVDASASCCATLTSCSGSQKDMAKTAANANCHGLQRGQESTAIDRVLAASVFNGMEAASDSRRNPS